MTLLTGHVALVSILVQTKRTLVTLHDAHVQMRLLLEAGDSRYLGWAVDDLEEATDELDEIDKQRRSVTGDDPADRWIETAPPDIRETLQRLTAEIDGLLQHVEDERKRARATCHFRIQAAIRRHR